MPTGTKRAGTGAPENRSVEADPHAAGMTDIEDMEYAIDILRVKLQSAPSLLEKVRLYNQIKTLQDNISRRKSEG